MAVPPKRPPAPSLAAAQAAAQAGDWITAHRICLHVTREDPDNEAAWLLGATTAQSVEDTLVMLGHVLKLNPDNRQAHQALHEAMKERLRKDAFLAYAREDDAAGLIYARTANSLELALPRRRALALPAAPPAARAASRWLSWAMAGLVPAGLGALLCAPIAFLSALGIVGGRDADYRRQGIAVIVLAAAVFALGITFAALFVLHLPLL